MMYSGFVEMCAVTVGMVQLGGVVQEKPFIESPNPDAMMHKPSDPVVATPSGILLQRCGGGRRVIRKRLGAS